MVEEPPRPSPRARTLRRLRSASSAKRRARSCRRCRRGWRTPRRPPRCGRGGCARARRAAAGRAARPAAPRRQALVAERGQRAGGAAELQHQRLLRSRASRSRERCSAAAYSASLSPNGIGSACCSQVRATTRVWRWRPASAAKPVIARSRSASSASMPARRSSTAPVSIDVLAGRAPMHEARGLGVALGDVGRQRLDQRDGEIAGPGRGLGQRGEVEGFGLARIAIVAGALAGITPTAASARASAASKSSMLCRRARSSQTARIAALTTSAPAAEGKGRAHLRATITRPAAANPLSCSARLRMLCRNALFRRRTTCLMPVIERRSRRHPDGHDDERRGAACGAARGGLGQAERSGSAEGLHSRLRELEKTDDNGFRRSPP